MASHGLLNMLLKIPVLNILILLVAVLSLEILGDRFMRFLVNHEQIGDQLRERGLVLSSHLPEVTRDG